MSDDNETVLVMLLKEKLRREVLFLHWLEKQPYCDTPLGKEMRKSATLHRIALRNSLAELCPELVAHE